MSEQAAAPDGALPALTERQRLVYDWIRAYVRSHGAAPTFRAAAAGLGLSLNGTMGHVLALERKGYLARESRRARSLRLLVEEPLKAERREGAIALDCGDRVYWLDDAGARRLGQALLRLTDRKTPPARP